MSVWSRFLDNYLSVESELCLDWQLGHLSSKICTHPVFHLYLKIATRNLNPRPQNTKVNQNIESAPEFPRRAHYFDKGSIFKFSSLSRAMMREKQLFGLKIIDRLISLITKWSLSRLG